MGGVKKSGGSTPTPRPRSRPNSPQPASAQQATVSGSREVRTASPSPRLPRSPGQSKPVPVPRRKVSRPPASVSDQLRDLTILVDSLNRHSRTGQPFTEQQTSQYRKQLFERLSELPMPLPVDQLDAQQLCQFYQTYKDLQLLTSQRHVDPDSYKWQSEGPLAQPKSRFCPLRSKLEILGLAYQTMFKAAEVYQQLELRAKQGGNLDFKVLSALSGLTEQIEQWQPTEYQADQSLACQLCCEAVFGLGGPMPAELEQYLHNCGQALARLADRLNVATDTAPKKLNLEELPPLSLTEQQHDSLRTSLTSLPASIYISELEEPPAPLYNSSLTEALMNPADVSDAVPDEGAEVEPSVTGSLSTELSTEDSQSMTTEAPLNSLAFVPNPAAIGPYQPSPPSSAQAIALRELCQSNTPDKVTDGYAAMAVFNGNILELASQLTTPEQARAVMLTPHCRLCLKYRFDSRDELDSYLAQHPNCTPENSYDITDWEHWRLDNVVKQNEQYVQKYVIEPLRLDREQLKVEQKRTPYVQLNSRTRGSKVPPLAHQQVHFHAPDGKPHPMIGSHIQMQGKYLGIARQAPYAYELEPSLRAISDHRIPVVVDLVSDTDARQAKKKGEEVLRLDSQDIKLDQLPFEAHLDSLTPATAQPGQPPAAAARVTVNVDGTLHSFTQLTFPDWSDGSGLRLDKALPLVRQVSTTEPAGGPYMINCMAGLGRTGQLFCMLNVWDNFSRQGLSWQDIDDYCQQYGLEATCERDPDNPEDGKITTESIIHGRFSRSGDFVQVPAQALCSFQFESLCHRALQAKQQR